jgi:hypothetical protein
MNDGLTVFRRDCDQVLPIDCRPFDTSVVLSERKTVRTPAVGSPRNHWIRHIGLLGCACR